MDLNGLLDSAVKCIPEISLFAKNVCLALFVICLEIPQTRYHFFRHPNNRTLYFICLGIQAALASAKSNT